MPLWLNQRHLDSGLCAPSEVQKHFCTASVYIKVTLTLVLRSQTYLHSPASALGRSDCASYHSGLEFCSFWYQSGQLIPKRNGLWVCVQNLLRCAQLVWDPLGLGHGLSLLSPVGFGLQANENQGDATSQPVYLGRLLAGHTDSRAFICVCVCLCLCVCKVPVIPVAKMVIPSSCPLAPW